MNRHSKEIFSINLFFLILAALLLTLGVIVQQMNLMLGLFITEWFLIFVPTYVYIRAKGISIKELRVQVLPLRDGLLTILVTLFSYPIVIFMSITFNYILSLFVEFDLVSIPLPTSFEEYLIYLPIVALSAGICEEFFFRGLMMSVYGKTGKRNAIIISSLLFGLFHFNYQNFIGPVILGIIFGYLVYKTGSIFAGVIGHITNNFISITLGYIITINSPQLEQTAKSVDETTGLISAMITWGIMAFICLQIVKRLINKIGMKHEIKEVEVMHLNQVGKMPWIPIGIVAAAYLTLTIMSFNL